MKIPPGSLGIGTIKFSNIDSSIIHICILGMYQHDLAQSELTRRLSEVIEECVNGGGVDINTCSAHLLMYVSGMNSARARAVIEHREKNGRFESVSLLRMVKGIGEISFRNAAGFLRVYGASEILDATAVHPDHYDTLRDMLAWAADEFGACKGNDHIMKNYEAVSSTNNKSRSLNEQTIKDPINAKLLAQVVQNIQRVPLNLLRKLRTTLDITITEAGWPDDIDMLRSTINSWRDWLSKYSSQTLTAQIPWCSDITPGKPPIMRNKQKLIQYSIDNYEKDRLHKSEIGPIQGVVKNIVPFGAFVDVGMLSDGLIHRSKFLPEETRTAPLIDGEAYRLKDVVIGQRLNVYVLSQTPPNRIELGFHRPHPVSCTKEEYCIGKAEICSNSKHHRDKVSPVLDNAPCSHITNDNVKKRKRYT